ncbi:MAG TPA: hypothetical protein VLE70_10385 [Anaerolineae bacterium]|jgi:hypothetical protein|nr:hypothetical protein [Anaerolineae bacterium]
METPTDVQSLATSSDADTAPFSRLVSVVNWRLIATALSLFLLFVVLLAIVQWGTPALVGTDGYYHARMGLLIREQGLKPDFEWLPLTILSSESFYDHHLLYHAYLSLFAGRDPVIDAGRSMTQGIKLASLIMPALAFMAVWWLLRTLKVRWAAVWTLGLFVVSEAFLYRMSMPRAQSASLLVLALGLYALFSGRHWLLAPLGFLYVWLYDAFPLLLVAGVVYIVATWLTERRFAWQALAFPAAGIALGLVLNPYYPQNIPFILNHLLPKIGDSTTQVGNEWYPYRSWTLVENSGFALAAFVLGALAWSWRKERIDRSGLTLFLLTVLFGLLLFRSRRFVEYFPAFALLFAAVSLSGLYEGLMAGRKRWPIVAPALLALILVGPLALTLSQARESVGRSKAADQYAQAAIWLADNSSPGQMVFQTDWDDFPRLFFYNDSNIYTAGLDPTYMELKDADLFAEWRAVTRGEVDRPGEVIRDRFGASYVFTDLDHDAFIEQASEDPLLEELYRDEYAAIFGVATD